MDLKEDILSQLHAQFAENSNAIYSCVISVLVAVLAVLGAYGHVFVHSSSDLTCSNYMYDSTSGLYTVDALLYVTSAVLIVITLLNYLCMSLGYKQRKEQFIAFSVRYCVFKQDCENGQCLNAEYYKIFPNNYHPLGKRIGEIIPYLYQVMIQVLWILFLLILSATLFRLVVVINLRDIWDNERSGVIALIASIVLSLVLALVKYGCIYYGYRKCNEQWKEMHCEKKIAYCCLTGKFMNKK